MIHAVILSGGWGTRLWPKSRKRFPKQLLCLNSRRSPLQNLVEAIKSQVKEQRIWIVANKIHALRLRRQLPALPRKNFLIEPLAKNTAAAIGLASVLIERNDPQAVTVVISCDHILGRKRRFLQTIKAASRLAQAKDVLIPIGINPEYVATEFGYLKTVHSSQFTIDRKKVYKVEKFVEKPNLKKARAYFRNKSYLWNSGIFVWKASSILAAIERHQPRLYQGLKKIAAARRLPQYKQQLLKQYRRFKDISIDFAVMEKSRNLYTVVGDFFWQDLGSWDYLYRGGTGKDRQGNITLGLHKGFDTCGSLILSEKDHLIGTVGVRDLIIVHTPSSTLVCPKDKVQQVKKLTGLLEKDKHLSKYL